VTLARAARRSQCLLILAMAVCCPGLAQVGEDKHIGEVRISGNALVGEPLIRSHIRTRAGETYSAVTVRKDVRELFALGYFTDIKVDVEPGPQGLVVTYIVAERPVIDKISILGNDKLSDKSIRAELRLRETDTYTPSELRRDIEKIISLYGEESFPTATVNAAVHPVAPGKVHLVYTIDEGYKSRVRGISFVGNTVFTDKELRKALHIRKAFWIFGGTFDQEKFETGLDNILAIYGDRGYVEATVTTDMDYRKKGRLYLTLYIEEGAQYRVGSVDLTGNDAFLDDEIIAMTTVHTDDVFNRGAVLGDIGRGVPGDTDRIERFYIDNGYIYATASPQVRYDRDRHIAHITYSIREHDLVYISAVDIVGNVKTKDEVIRRRLVIRPGDRYDGQNIRRSVRNVLNLGYFDGPPQVSHRSVDDQLADLVLRVEEGDTGTFNFGGGFSSEEGLIGFTQLSLRNFDIANWPTFSGGGQQLSLRFEKGTVREEISLGFTDPYFLSYPLSFGVDLYTRRLEYWTHSDFAEKRSGGRISFGKWFTDDVRLNMRFRADQIEIYNVEEHTSSELKEEEGTRDTFSLTLGITRDTRDYFFDPSAGSRLRLSVETAGGPFDGDTDFVKVIGDGIWYWSAFEKLLTLSVQQRLGLVQEYGRSEGVPLFERFFVGGSTTVRGYDYRDIGPKSDDIYRDPIGGTIQAISNIELGWRLNEFLGLYAFADGGTAWWDYDEFDLDDMRFSVGLGFGVRTPMGPMRFDYGVPLNPDDDQGNGRFHFTTGLKF